MPSGEGPDLMKKITDVKEQEKETYFMMLRSLFQVAWILTVQVSHVNKASRPGYFTPV